MRNLLASLLIFLSFYSKAQNNNVLPERQIYKLNLPVDKGSVYEMDVPASPYVQKNSIVQIYPGETIYLEAEERDGNLLLTSVKKIEHPEKTITVTCIQNIKNKKHEGIMLKVDNPFKKDLVYTAMIFPMNANKWLHSNVLPVNAGLSSFELWPDVILTIGLANWKFAYK
jgi:hypothetical protein